MLFHRKYRVVPIVLACLLMAISAGARENSGGKSAADPEPYRVWKVNDPLYKELLSGTPAGDQKSGVIYWTHTYQPTLDEPFAREYGIRYSNEEALKEMADSKLLPLRASGSFEDKFFFEMADKYGFKMLFQPDVVRWASPDAPSVGTISASFILDPRGKEYYFNDLKDSLKNYRKYIWAVYTGDEITEVALYQAVRLYVEHKDDYPYIRQVNEQVKNQFGFGKYGMPESLDDPNPYRWIALRRWLNSEMTGIQKDVYDLVRTSYPEMRVISIDPVCNHKPVAWDKMSPYFDIATQQLYPPVDTNRQQFGFTTKMVADLTGKPTWPCTHVENYAYSTTLEEVRELMSEVMRNGGKGFHWWLKDEVGNNADHGFMMATKWGFPARWREMTEINLMNARMNEVAVPTDPDLAILYPEDYYQSMSEKVAPFPYMYPNEPEWAYTFFGPVARTWFKFVNDNMVEDKKVDLSGFKAVVVPAAKYERKSVVDAIAQYVSAGGTLVIGDPETFTTDDAGVSLADLKAKLIGASCEAGNNQSNLKFGADCSMPSLRDRTLSVSGSVFTLTPDSGVEVMARFADGSPAVILNHVGKGRVITFASSPFTESGIADQGWKDFFTAFSKDLGLQTGRKIWRFQFPESKTAVQPDPKGVCLTGNYIKWWQDKPNYVQDASIPGTYSYSLAPDDIADRDVPSAVTFTAGKLMDRTKAFTTPKDKLNPEDFIVSWKTEKPTDVTFDLVQTQSVDRVHLWYAGQLPSIKVAGSADGKTWKQLAANPGKALGNKGDVLDVSLKLAANKARYIRLSLGARDAGNPMSLVECEIWGSGK